MFMEGDRVKDGGGVVGLFPKVNRNAIDERFSVKAGVKSAVSRCQGRM